MDSLILSRELNDMAATRALGAHLAALILPGDVVTLSGPLGAGKTELARAVLRARLSDPDLDAPSPTFTLVQTYMAPDLLEIWHVDLYRLDHLSEIAELGLEDAFRSGACLIEWPDRLGPFLPGERLDISLTQKDGMRRADLVFRGARWRERIDGLR